LKRVLSFSFFNHLSCFFLGFANSNLCKHYSPVGWLAFESTWFTFKTPNSHTHTHTHTLSLSLSLSLSFSHESAAVNVWWEERKRGRERESEGKEGLSDVSSFLFLQLNCFCDEFGLLKFRFIGNSNAIKISLFKSRQMSLQEFFRTFLRLFLLRLLTSLYDFVASVSKLLSRLSKPRQKMNE